MRFSLYSRAPAASIASHNPRRATVLSRSATVSFLRTLWRRPYEIESGVDGRFCHRDDTVGITGSCANHPGAAYLFADCLPGQGAVRRDGDEDIPSAARPRKDRN